jgi:hypothetical protein
VVEYLLPLGFHWSPDVVTDIGPALYRDHSHQDNHMDGMEQMAARYLNADPTASQTLLFRARPPLTHLDLTISQPDFICVRISPAIRCNELTFSPGCQGGAKRCESLAQANTRTLAHGSRLCPTATEAVDDMASAGGLG